jgi:hypothetical protein
MQWMCLTWAPIIWEAKDVFNPAAAVAIYE